MKLPAQRSPWCLLCSLLLTVWTVMALQAPALAQKKAQPPKWKIDPYTKNDPELIEKAGYVGFGPMPFGALGSEVVDSDHIENQLQYVQLLWIETPHFRLGINLPAYTIPMQPEIRAKIRAELERLSEKLPRVNPKTRRLDPWLRAHLFAQRVEDLYAEFQQLAGVKDEDFPQSPDDLVIQPGKPYMGQGPYLGMKEKYLLLLFDREASFHHYMKTYLGRDATYGQRWHFKDVSALIFTVAAECEDGRLKDDTALHGHVNFNMMQLLLNGFRYYSYDLPVWIREGLGHWAERRVSPRFNSFDQTEGSPADARSTWKWEPHMRGLLVSGKFAPFAEAYTWRDFGNITFNDHVAVWSRVDFMMAQDPERWRSFLFQIKGRVTENWLPDQSDLVGATREALQKAYGLSPLNFDEKWSDWVRANYSAQ